MIKKDLDLLNKNFAKGTLYIAGLIKEQEAVIKTSGAGIIELNKTLKELQKKLMPYVEGKEIDADFMECKEQYEQALIDRNSYQSAITIAEESISAAKLHEI